MNTDPKLPADRAAGQLSRRRFLQVSGAGLAGLLLAACAAPVAPAGEGQAAAGAATGEVTTLAILHANWGELYNGLMEKIGEDFTAANPNIKLDWTFESEWKTKLLTLVAGGTPPDAAYTNWQANANLAAKNTFTQLDSYVEAASAMIL
jgi:ABC-type glycerol-3-phosphate transport system substrate-binding protein